ncbi:uncharacterized protein [Ptychodera flava]|uniref:uncharacterized protein n=1 Tax=Ptychodera flava TaxID=63121 RepID=UPI00396A18C0
MTENSAETPEASGPNNGAQPRPKRSRAGHRTRMERLLQQAEELMEQPVNTDRLDTLSGLIKTMEEKIKTIRLLDETILQDTTDDGYNDELIEQDEVTTGFILRIEKVRRYFTRQENEVSVVPTQANTSPPHTDNVSKRTVHLPKLSLPRFAGDLLQWKTFHDSFDSAVNQDSSLSNVQKFQYLRGQLDDEASRVIEGLALTNDNYEKAMDLLRARFGQTHKLVSAYMRALWEIRQPRDKVEDLRQFYDILESYIRGLESLGKVQDSYGDLLVPVIIDKIPGRIRTLITREHGDKEWRLQDLRTAILKEIHAAEAGTSSGQTTDVTDPQPTAAFLVKNNHRSPSQQKAISLKSRPCVFCKASHSPTVCAVVTDPVKRMEIVKRDLLCFNCFGTHKAAVCTSKFRCRKCSRKHHTALCNSTDHITKKPESETVTVHSKLALGDQKHQCGPVLLKTAVTTAVNGNNRIKVNVLLDEGSQRSFITDDCANLLKLQMQGTEKINLAPFGSTSNGIRAMNNTTVHLETVTGPNISVKVLIIARISTPMRTHLTRSVLDLPHLKNSTLLNVLVVKQQKLTFSLGQTTIGQ